MRFFLVTSTGIALSQRQVLKRLPKVSAVTFFFVALFLLLFLVEGIFFFLLLNSDVPSLCHLLGTISFSSFQLTTSLSDSRSENSRLFETVATLSSDDGNGNGDGDGNGETEERLRRGRGCVAKLQAVKLAQ